MLTQQLYPTVKFFKFFFLRADLFTSGILAVGDDPLGIGRMAAVVLFEN